MLQKRLDDGDSSFRKVCHTQATTSWVNMLMYIHSVMVLLNLPKKVLKMQFWPVQFGTITVADGTLWSAQDSFTPTSATDITLTNWSGYGWMPTLKISLCCYRWRIRITCLVLWRYYKKWIFQRFLPMVKTLYIAPGNLNGKDTWLYPGFSKPYQMEPRHGLTAEEVKEPQKCTPAPPWWLW